MPESSNKYNFRGQRPNEAVQLVVRQHTWLLTPAAFGWLLSGAVIILGLWGFGASKVSSVIIVITVIAAGLFSFYRWFLWSNGVYIVTNQRVIKVSQLGFFKRLISEAEINRIQEISTEIIGPVHTILNFGTIKIQTASSSGRIDLENVPDPYDIQQEIVRISRQEPERPVGNV